MAVDHSPAFSFYAKDFIVGTATMSLVTRGAYITLLAYQWDHGSVPGQPGALARIWGVSPAQAAKLWGELTGKFEAQADGQWRNARLELERQKQARWRTAQQANGRLGGRPPGNPTQTHGFPKREPKPNPNVTEALTQSEPKPNPSETLSFSSSFPVVSASHSRSLVRDPECDPIQMRAGKLLERYQELFYVHRHGARYHNRMHLDFPKACELVRTWPDDAHLEKLAVIILTTDDDWIAKTDRGFAVFAARATWADDRLTSWAREQLET